MCSIRERAPTSLRVRTGPTQLRDELPSPDAEAASRIVLDHAGTSRTETHVPGRQALLGHIRQAV